MELVSYRTVNIYNLENPEKCLIVIIMGFFNWLTSRNLFQIESTNLHALSTGFVSIANKNGVSCNEAGDGAKIQV